MEEDVDRLYGLDLGDFVVERDALAKARRADGDKNGAARVKALAKPTRAAWATNRVVRGQRKAVGRLEDAADALAQAQEAALAGGDAAGMRSALDAVRAAIAGLVEHVPEAESAGTRDAVAGTLQAAVMDPDARQAVLDARLERELEPAGFGGIGSGAPKARPTGRRRAPADDEQADAGADGQAADDAKARGRKQDAARKQAEAAIADARTALTAARKAANTADKARDAAQKAQQRAQERLDAARRTLEDAQVECDAAKTTQEAAEAEAEGAHAQVAELETGLEHAQAQLDGAD